MKCVIPALHIKIFGKAIQSLAKVGDEISIEPTLEGLLVKAVNTTKSCMGWYCFKPRFFQHYDDGSPRPLDQNSTPRYRLTAKCCLNVFKSLNHMDKLVEHCHIKLNESGSRVVFSLHCKHGIVKCYNLTYMEGDPLNCSLTKGSCSNVVKAGAKLYLDIVSSFPSSMSELTLMAKQRSMSVRNYIDGDLVDPRTSINTTMTLDREEFDTFQVNTETSVSFNIREVKAALMFAEVTALNVSVYFDEAGKPMFINMDSDPTFEMTFIISTICETMSQSSTTSEAVANTSAIANTSQPHTTSTPSTSSTSRTHNTKPTNRKFCGKLSSAPSTSHSPSTSRSPPHRSETEHRKGSTATKTHNFATSVPEETTSVVEVKPRLDSLMNDTSMTLLVPNNQTTSHKPRDDIDELLKEIDDDSKVIEPLTKRAKFTFFNKKSPAKPPLNTQAFLDDILAEDSDDDD